MINGIQEVARSIRVSSTKSSTFWVSDSIAQCNCPKCCSNCQGRLHQHLKFECAAALKKPQSVLINTGAQTSPIYPFSLINKIASEWEASIRSTPHDLPADFVKSMK